MILYISGILRYCGEVRFFCWMSSGLHVSLQLIPKVFDGTLQFRWSAAESWWTLYT